MERYYLIKHITKNPYIYFDYISNQYRIFDLKFREEERLMRNAHWQKEIQEHCERYGINKRYFDYKDVQQSVIMDLAQKQQKFWDDGEVQVLKNILSSTYGVKYEKPKKINEELALKGVPIRIHYGKGSAGEMRDVKFWQILLVEDFERLDKKK